MERKLGKQGEGAIGVDGVALLRIEELLLMEINGYNRL